MGGSHPYPTHVYDPHVVAGGPLDDGASPDDDPAHAPTWISGAAGGDGSWFPPFWFTIADDLCFKMVLFCFFKFPATHWPLKETTKRVAGPDVYTFLIKEPTGCDPC
jgi:hypothetical protein